MNKSAPECFFDRMNRIYRMGSASPTVKCGRLSPSTVLMLRYGYLSNITVGRRSRPHPVNPVHPVQKYILYLINQSSKTYIFLIINPNFVHTVGSEGNGQAKDIRRRLNFGFYASRKIYPPRSYRSQRSGRRVRVRSILCSCRHSLMFFS